MRTCVVSTSNMTLLLLLILSMIRATVTEAVQEVLGQCCEMGRNTTLCAHWQVPIPEVPQEYQEICVATMEVCCLANTREKSCTHGQLMAKEGQLCQVPLDSNQTFDEIALTECCIACNIGAMTPAEDCSRWVHLMPSQYAQNSFAKCCFGTDLLQATNVLNNDRCPGGFIFNSALEVCDDIDECYENTNICDPDFEKCVNTIGDYICEPIIGLLSNDTCPPGFKFYLINCIDIDECEENLHNCSKTDVCVNTEGSFKCDQWNAESSNGNILCPRGYRIDPIKELCVDINECATDNNCNENQRCVNTLGKYNKNISNLLILAILFH